MNNLFLKNNYYNFIYKKSSIIKILISYIHLVSLIIINKTIIINSIPTKIFLIIINEKIFS